jgi:isoleucyl-tRNA synthetase
LGDFDPARHARPLDALEPLDLAALGAFNDALERAARHYDEAEFHLVTATLADGFCINVLSEFYLDVRKDVLYCDAPDAPRRRSAQTAFWIIARGLAKVLAPLLSFTAEETWQTLREENKLGADDNPESVFLNPFPTTLDLPRTPAMAEFLRARRAANEAVEKARQSGAVKSANDAALPLTLPAGGPLADLGPAALASFLGVAVVRLEFAAVEAPVPGAVTAAPGAKCARCWLWRELTPAGLCARCADAERAVQPA